MGGKIIKFLEDTNTPSDKNRKYFGELDPDKKWIGELIVAEAYLKMDDVPSADRHFQQSYDLWKAIAADEHSSYMRYFEKTLKARLFELEARQ